MTYPNNPYCASASAEGTQPTAKVSTICCLTGGDDASLLAAPPSISPEDGTRIPDAAFHLDIDDILDAAEDPSATLRVDNRGNINTSDGVAVPKGDFHLG